MDAVELTGSEEEVLGFLDHCLREHAAVSHVVLRVAGGWVRDKLLGKESNDIDIMVQGMEARAFCELVQSALERRGQRKKSIAVMEADPEHGKHVANCNMTIFGNSIDFVSLRGSSPLGDAQHRDLTINAIFYNINRRQVEDVTEMGVSDLRRGILRAPTDPAYMLNYDPLRAVRVARFAAKTSYSVDPSLVEAMSRPEFRQQLAKRTKRDRIGQELKKALGAPDAAATIELLARTGLLEVVILGSDGEIAQNQAMAEAAAGRCRAVQELWREYPNRASSGVVLQLAACLFGLVEAGPQSQKVKDSAMCAVVVGSMRLSHSDGEAVTVTVRGAQWMLGFTQQPTRLQLGLCLRMCGSLWSTAWLVAAAVAPDRRQDLEIIARLVFEMQLDNVWKMKPMLNGNEISRLLNLTPGPAFAVITERLIEEQLKRPSMTYSEAEDFLRANFGQRG